MPKTSPPARSPVSESHYCQRTGRPRLLGPPPTPLPPTHPPHPCRSRPHLPAPAATPAPFVRSPAAELSWRSASLGWARLALAGLHRARLRFAPLLSPPPRSTRLLSTRLLLARLGSARLDSARLRLGARRQKPGLLDRPLPHPLLAVDRVRGPDSERGDRVWVAACGEGRSILVSGTRGPRGGEGVSGSGRCWSSKVGAALGTRAMGARGQQRTQSRGGRRHPSLGRKRGYYHRGIAAAWAGTAGRGRRWWAWAG